MGLLTVPILATLHTTQAIGPAVLAVLLLALLGAGSMGLLSRLPGLMSGLEAGEIAKQPAMDLVPQRVLIASHEPALRSLIGRRAAAPSRAPPSRRHLVLWTALVETFPQVRTSVHSSALPGELDRFASAGALRSSAARPDPKLALRQRPSL